MDFGGFWMKPNFDEMSKAELKAYVLSHRDDDEAIRVLFSRRNPPDSEATWYGPMCTPEGVPIEENIRIAEEAIRRRTKIDRINDQFTSQTMTTVTQEEIQQFREQLRNYPEAIAALDVIQECDGYVEDAVTLLMMRETGQEPDRGVREWLQKCRTAICQEDVKEALAAGLIAPAIEPLAISTGFPPGTATVLGILAFKIGIKKLCDSPSSES
jgi:hypothetical protein